MNNTNSHLIYEDQNYTFIPYRKLVMTIGPVLLVGLIVGVWLGAGSFYGIFVLSLIVFLGLLMWLTNPRSYQVYDDHIRIEYRFRSKQATYDTIDRIGYVEVQTPAYSWVYGFERPSFQVVKISRAIDGDISFSPWDSETFIEKATEALKNWRKNNPVPFDWDDYLEELEELQQHW